MRTVLMFGAAAAAAVTLVGVIAPAEALTEPVPGDGAAPRSSGGPGVSASAVMVTPAPPRSDTYAYGDDDRQVLDAYWRAPAASRERTTSPRPGVLLLHGGSWRRGDKSGWRYTARRLTTLGYVVFSANYRLAQTARWPAQREDSQNALAYIKRNARLWNLDPNRIVVMGSSAGGHLATQLGTYGTGAAEVRGVVALSPVVSPQRAYQDGGVLGADRSRRSLRQAVQMLLGCDPATDGPVCRERLNDASAATHAGPGDPPMLLIHSRGEFVPPAHGTVLAAVLGAAGVPATVNTVPGKDHGGALLDDTVTFDSVVRWMDEVVRG
ncbi:alpha/beta hydrolase [Thermomonospora umbrina]|uniref:Acetyl esterase/lipase n=1 Tax=Thermomonospora umbrina TaxID=111806 RepID=A0A3D9ST07_9ACTN|nr:alpha/beta hydrolase [Thermomonospora umbrina]REE96105.1 acetyl esterase/lipase [Thermomonospora umbrina]